MTTNTTTTKTPERIGRNTTHGPLAGKREERAAEIARRFPELARQTTTTPKR
jgi:hypothetical protein